VNAQAVLNGSVLKLASSYVIMLEADDCVSGKKLVELQTQAADKDGTLRALSNITSTMRHQLGESLHSVQGFDVPIEQSTTSSFDALVAYSRGYKLSDADSIPFFERAIQLDPNFAMSYEQLGVVYGNLADFPAAKRAFAKAYELRQPTDAYEQFVITSRYYEIVQNDLDLAAKNYELWARSYPLNHWVWGTLANTYTQMGYYPQAIAAGEHGMAVDRDYGFTYVVLSRAYKRASQFEKAKAICNESIARNHNSWGIHSILFQVAFAEHDEAAMARETAWDKGQSTENQTLDNAAFGAATLGQLKKADQLFQQAQDSPSSQATVEYALDIDADKAEAERLLGDFNHARAHAVHVPIDRDETSFQAAINAALSGETAYAKRVIEQEKLAPSTSTLMQKVRIPLLLGAIALQEHKPAQAVSLIQPARVYEFRDYYVPSLLGEAYLELHQAPEAISEYQEILANPGIDPLSPMFPLAHLGLARAYALQHQNSESRDEYQKFFALWNAADTDTPMLKIAREEYGRLPDR
jgi:tetratricopeptide (TPR) repeat protein